MSVVNRLATGLIKVFGEPKRGFNPCSPGERKEGTPALTGASVEASHLVTSDGNLVGNMSHSPSDINKLGLPLAPGVVKVGSSHSSSDGNKREGVCPVQQKASTNLTIKDSKDSNDSKKRKKERKESSNKRNSVCLRDSTTETSSVVNKVIDPSLVKTSKTNGSTTAGELPSSQHLALSDYHQWLPASTPLAPPPMPGSGVLSGTNLALPEPLPPLPDCASNESESEETISEDSILLITSNGIKVELVLNSILCYTSQALDKGITSKVLTDLLLHFYENPLLETAWNIARSLLKKKDRPQRGQINYSVSTTVKIDITAKQIISMVRQIMRDQNIILASYGLQVPLMFYKCHKPGAIDQFDQQQQKQQQ